ncbi:hypothetical protein C8E03_11496 [Lachnotalea glycerini]|uniref:DUF3021 family protein n=1 Tax=Lachnotalea glycerini TaxID=1763509 RepID=A0A255IMQ5_9FIRM|nr:DUF3021 family protein [Lachnotalea glycerini]PXV86017.1 hypothetical protein C8E03_11496 [Lachnotalea glycerini]RDY30736.1 DUF3021 family protein [Lachnotalea glycerini]
MSKIKSILNTFVYVTTAVVFATAVYIKIFWKNSDLSVDILWEILSVSLFCSFGNLFYINKHNDFKDSWSKKQLVIRTVLHYFYINLIVIGFGIFYEWFYWYRIDMMLAILVMILVIFATIWFVNLQRDKRLAIQLNQKIREYYTKE